MKYISAVAELLYVISNYEKGRVRSSGIWDRKYVESLNKSLEIMSLLTNLILENREISQDEIHFLQVFIHENKGIIFSGERNISTFLCHKNEFDFTPNDFEDIINLMNDIILEIKKLLCTKQKNYKTKISYLLRAFHNLPKVFIDPNNANIFNFGIQPIAQHEAIEYAFSYLSLNNKI